MSRMQSDFLSQLPKAQEMDNIESLQTLVRIFRFFAFLALGIAAGATVLAMLFLHPDNYVNWELVAWLGICSSVILIVCTIVLAILEDKRNALLHEAYDEIRENVQENTREGIAALKKKVDELEEDAKPTKRYNSMAMIAFTVDHDDYDTPTEEELRAGFIKRFNDLMEEPENPITNAVGGDILDTVENEYDADGNPIER